MGRNIKKLITILAALCLLFALGATVLAEETADSLITDGNITDGDITGGDIPDEPVPVFSMGDVNDDGKVGAGDARLVLRSAVGLEEIAPAVIVYADMNFDGEVNAGDARLILRVSVNLEKTTSHNLELGEIIASTCTAKGSLAYTCKHCEQAGSIVIPVLPHDYKAGSYVAPTCTAKGSESKVCKDCGKTVTKAIKELGHSYEIVSRVEPTCSKEGTLNTRCKNCSATFSAPIKKTEHKWVRCTATTPQYCSVCNEKTAGVQQAATGLYYYFIQSGNTYTVVKNQIIGSSYYGPDGARVDNDEAIDAAVNFVNSYTTLNADSYTRLEQAYNLLWQYFEYFTNMDVTARPDGRMLPGFVVQFFEEGGGNCFRFATTFAYIARVLGYDSGFISGQITASGGGTTTHGMTEIYYNNRTYWCDPMMQTSYPNINTFWVTESTYPYGYSYDYRIRMYVSNGEVIWQ